jgi:hypothetical protein
LIGSHFRHFAPHGKRDPQRKNAIFGAWRRQHKPKTILKYQNQIGFRAELP